MRHLLKTHFGYDSFKPLQENIIQTVLSKQDCLVLMPTGGGKSLCYQLPALKFSGLTLVVSPLIALMKDQVDALRENGIAAAFVNSTLGAEELRQTLVMAEKGELKILYLAPERLAMAGFKEWLRGLNVSLIAIDEAHCISEWGHDFRPDYRNLKQLRRDFPDVPVIALTATATPKVRRDIQTQLGLEKSKTFLGSFNRVNLRYHVRPKRAAFQSLCELLEKYKQEPAIVYCFSRKNAEELAADLRAEGFPAAAYHAGLDPKTRRDTQDKFIRDEISTIVATIAFGMGIDKPDIRLVAHYDLPKTVEGYYQETGRAGRDGLPAECVLFYSYGDTRKHEFFIEKMTSEEERARAGEKLAQIVDYCELTACRREYLLNYFGEETNEENCQNCDGCLNPVEMFDATEIAQKILSAVLRTGERFGLNYIIDVLKGSRAESVRERGHDQLSVYGIVGREFGKQELKDLARELLRRDFLHKNSGEYPTVAVSSKGKKWLAERGRVQLARPARSDESVSSPAVTGAPLDYDRELFERLRALRKSIADRQNVPPFIIFGNTSLIEMASYFPQSEDSFLRITGVGQEKLARYGREFIDLITDYAREHGREEKPNPKQRPTNKDRSLKRQGSTYSLTKELIETGLSTEETARRRNMSPSTIIGHLEQIITARHEMNMSHLKPERFDIIKEAFTKTEGMNLAPVKEILGEDFTYIELRLARLFL